MIIIIYSLSGIILYLLFELATKSFKVGYYEQTLKNNKRKFDETRWNHIEQVMNKKHPF